MTNYDSDALKTGNSDNLVNELSNIESNTESEMNNLIKVIKKDPTSKSIKKPKETT